MGFFLQPASLDWALKHVESHGDTDIFPVPFEYLAIRSAWEEKGPDSARPQPTFRDYLTGQDLFTWIVRPYRRCISPKHRVGFRVSTQLDPLDMLLFTALVYEIGADLEGARIPKDQRIVHSYRFLPNPEGRMYDPVFGYDSYRARSAELAAVPDCQYVVLADIADFFPRIYSHPLENALMEATCGSEHAKAISKILNGWNYNISYGLPVGSSASRLLAEVVISDVDAALRSEQYQFVRFSDDYRIFCPNERKAYEALVS